MPTIGQWCDRDVLKIQATGTSEGSIKGWDTRGRSNGEIANGLTERGFRKVSTSGNKKFSRWRHSSGKEVSWNHNTGSLIDESGLSDPGVAKKIQDTNKFYDSLGDK